LGFLSFIHFPPKPSLSLATSLLPCSENMNGVESANLDIARAEERKVLANDAFKARKYSQAIDLYSEAIGLNSENAVYWANRAFAHTKLEEYGSAIQDATRAIEVDPKYSKGYYRRGAAYLAMGKFKDALKDFQQVKRICPNDPDAAKEVEGMLVAGCHHVLGHPLVHPIGQKLCSYLGGIVGKITSSWNKENTLDWAKCIKKGNPMSDSEGHPILPRRKKSPCVRAHLTQTILFYGDVLDEVSCLDNLTKTILTDVSGILPKWAVSGFFA
ncbi:hypothetical protein IFM89_028678, partial [Coptis chinensis]